MKRFVAVLMLVILCVTGYVVPAAAEAWVCSACSTANEGKFCTECGAAKPVPTPTPAPKKCQQCSYTAPADSPFKFCPTCGLEFGKAPATPTPKPTPTPSPTPKPTPKPTKTPTPTPQRVFKVTDAERNSKEGTVTLRWTDSANKAPYKVTYRQHVSSDFNSSRQKKIWYYTEAESTYLTSCTFLYLEPSANYWFTITDRDGKEIVYAFKPKTFLTFDNFNVNMQIQLRKRVTGSGSKLNQFSRDALRHDSDYDWGAYVKLTFPKRGSTKDYVMHLVITDPNGIRQNVYRHDCLTLQKGWSYVYWDFYDFSRAFENANKYDGIATGSWRIDVYLNGAYACCQYFTVTD